MRKLSLSLAMLVVPSLVMAAEMTVTLAIQNMTCATCPITVRTAIKAVAGAKDVNVDFGKSIAIVVFDDALTNVGMLARASTDAGFPATRMD